MTGFLLRRIGTALVVVLGVSFIAFLLVTLLPGDPVRALFGFRRPPAGDVEQIRALLGLDDPFPIRYRGSAAGVWRWACK